MHNSKGVTLMSQKKYKSALKEFNIAIRLLPNNPVTHPIYNNIGVTYLELAKNSIKSFAPDSFMLARHAEGAFLRAIGYYPAHFSYYINLVETYELMGVLDAVCVEYQNNESLYAPIVVALIYKKQGKILEAQGVVDEFKQRNPELIINKNLDEYFK